MRKQHLEKLLARMDDRIKELISDCEEVDRREKGQGSWARVDKELVHKETLRQRIREALSSFDPDDNDTK